MATNKKPADRPTSSMNPAQRSSKPGTSRPTTPAAKPAAGSKKPSR